jgi:hypothetical protein
MVVGFEPPRVGTTTNPTTIDRPLGSESAVSGGVKVVGPRRSVHSLSYTFRDRAQESRMLPPQQNLWLSFGSGSRPRA